MIRPKPDAQRVEELLDELASLGWRPEPAPAVALDVTAAPVEDDEGLVPIAVAAERLGKTADCIRKAINRKRLGRSRKRGTRYGVDMRAALERWG